MLKQQKNQDCKKKKSKNYQILYNMCNLTATSGEILKSLIKKEKFSRL
jgi:hypothetical protein